jgi:ABC-type antimicrobial peptide transport system permease subunit
LAPDLKQELMMIKKYVLTTLRNFIRNRSYTLINVTGLSVGITSCIAIFLVISHDLSFDKFHTQHRDIYRVVTESTSGSGTEYGTATPYPLAAAFRNDFAGIPLTQIHNDEEGFLKVGSEKFSVNNVLFADSMFFKVFDYGVVSGNPSRDLGRPGVVFVTKALAARVLKNNATHIRLNNKLDLEVVGILEDPPANSHITFSMVVSMPSLNDDYVEFPIDSWGMTMSGYCYVVLPEALDPGQLDLAGFATKYLSDNGGSRKQFHLQPLSAIHFDERYTENPGNASNVSRKDLTALAVLGLFILIIACVNFINLTTALSVKRSKEIGIRKTLGAGRAQLTAYFLGETLLLTLISVVISLCAVEWLLRWLNAFLGLQLALDITHPMLLSFLLILVVTTTLLAGFYPAVMLSGFNPLAVLKNRITSSSGASGSVRKALVVFQFMIAQGLVISTLIMAAQMSYFRKKPLGFDKDFIVTVPLRENERTQLETFKNRLKQIPGVQQVSFSLGVPTSSNSFSTNYFLSDEGPEHRYRVELKPVDRDYLQAFGLRLKAGRWFTEAEENQASTLDSGSFVYVMNETAARQLGFYNIEEIVGKRITTGIGDLDAEVIGVVEDFHVRSLHESISPVVILNMPGLYYQAGIKLSPGNVQEGLDEIQRHYADVFPEYNFEYEFLDQHLATLYQRDERTFTLFKVFSGISIFIGCLGLYGLISFVASQKLKEVSIRKVLGATVGNIMILFSREFVILITIAFAIAAPLTHYMMTHWLNGFAYPIDIPWGVFLIGIAATMMIALLTVGYKSMQAALANPAETLRSE